MNDKKKEVRWFSIMDYEKEADYLSKRHQEGWEYLMNFNGYCYFRKLMARMQQKEEILLSDHKWLYVHDRTWST